MTKARLAAVADNRSVSGYDSNDTPSPSDRNVTLTLTYHAQTTVPVEVEGFTPDRARDKSLSEIERWEIFHGNRRLPLAEFFRVAGDPGDGEWDLVGDLSGVHWIGAHMREGTIRVRGPAGRHVGSQMTGGTMDVEGDAGDWVGGEMRGGEIRVRGRAGHLIGAAYRGSLRGMTGGTIVVDGDAGNEVGHTLRRGWITIGGAVGDMTAFNMIAGTVFVFGASGIRTGAGMRRGTIGLFGDQKSELLLTFRHACRFRPPFMPIMLRALQRRGFAIGLERLGGSFDLFHGDMIEQGRGEILVRA